MSTTGPIEIHVIADSTGDTAARVARAAQAQYASHDTRIIRHPRIHSAEGLHGVFERLDGPAEQLVVFSTLVDNELRALVTELCDQRRIAHADLLGPALAAMEHATGKEPERVVRPVGVGEDYFQRIQAMEFAVANDDGQLTSNLGVAEIVLIGVSRTGKTPLSMYLGYLGYRTANIPLVPGIAPPPELFRIDRWKIIGLTLDPERLVAIRRRRVNAMGARGRSGDGYAELAKVYDELDAVSAIQRRLGCPVIDTTSLALEEAAGRVIELVDNRRRAALGDQ